MAVVNVPSSLSAADIKLITAAGTLLEANATGLGFYGTAPVARPAAPTQPATTASTTTTPFGYTTQAQADQISAAVHALVGAFSAALGGEGLLS